jgi:pSer/pThr/pTyr-binding forkhead associated (FHA) protein
VPRLARYYRDESGFAEEYVVDGLAYLVIREGTKWSDVFRLVPGQSVIVGRAPTSQIVVKDERCSRSHCEIFFTGGKWILRDLESRNGTIVGNQSVRGDWELQPGDVIRAGRSQLVFVYQLSEAFSDTSSVLRRSPGAAEPAVGDEADDDSSVLSAYEPATITHRRGQTKFLVPTAEEPATEDTSASAVMKRHYSLP